MKVIRWIIGIPIGYSIYIALIGLNSWVVKMLYRFIPSEIFWSIESVFVCSVVSVYIGVAFAYFILPKDDFALINNKKVRVLKYAINIWSCAQVIFIGATIYEIYKYGLYQGWIFHLAFPFVALGMMHFTHNAITLVDFKHNRENREFYEELMRSKEEKEATQI